MIRLVLFDIDGTLIATGGAGLQAFGSVAGSVFGRPNGTARIPFAGRTDPSIVREFFRRHGIDPTPENFARFFEDYVFWLDHYLAHLPGRVLPGVEQVLAGLTKLDPAPVVGLLTGNIRLGAELKLRRYDLWHAFALGAFGDDHEDRNQLAVIARDRAETWFDHRLEGREILVIGDTPLDIDCARAIGARSLAVATGGTARERLEAHGADWVVDTLEAVDVRAWGHRWGDPHGMTVDLRRTA